MLLDDRASVSTVSKSIRRFYSNRARRSGAGSCVAPAARDLDVSIAEIEYFVQEILSRARLELALVFH
jgi:hypothetical protein